MMRLYPGDGLGTVIMTNATGFDVGKLLDRVHEFCVSRQANDGRRSFAIAPLAERRRRRPTIGRFESRVQT
jgi:hypothetical protein